MDKGIKNTDAVTRKLGPALTKAINYRLEVASEKKQKREEIVERRRTKTMAAKCQRAKERISLSSEEEKDYKSDSKDEIDPDPANDKYLLQL